MKPPRGERIAAVRSALGEREAINARECIASSWISSSGRFLDEFEQRLAAFFGVEHAIGCLSGSAALHLGLVGLGVQPADEVIVPDLAEIAAANAVRHCGATPVFADVDRATLTLDPQAFEARITPATKGVVAAALHGRPADMGAIAEVARRHGLFVMEDAGQAQGAVYEGRRVGGIGRCAAVSFAEDKIVTTGQGGAVLTDDGDLARLIRLYRGQGMDPARRYWFPLVGYNYRLTNLAAAIGVAQLDRVDEAIASRRRLAAAYAAELAPLADRILLPPAAPGAEPVHWMYAILLEDAVAAARDDVIARLDAVGIEARPAYRPLHATPPYAQSGDAFPHAVSCAARGICLPIHEGLDAADVRYIAAALDHATR